YDTSHQFLRFYFISSHHLRDLHSFPTRRSSDLLSRVTHYRESGGSERSRKQHKPQQQLGAQSQIVVALKEGLQNAVYPSELNKLPQGMRGLRKVSWSCHGR